MTARMRLRIRTFYLTMGTLLPLAVASTLCAAADTTAAAPAAAATPPAEPLQELKEVFVYGRKLATEIARTEDDLYYLYNRLNKDSDYDIVCGSMSLDRGSLISKRVCVPGFLADSINNRAPFPGMLGALPVFNSQNCSGSIMAGRDLNGPAFYEADCVAVGGTGYAISTRGYSSIASYSLLNAYPDPLESQIVLAQPISKERRQAYADNVMKVIHSDLRLMKTATHLAGLYYEMQSVQSQYAEMKAEARAARAAAPAKPNLGPRAAL